MSPPEPPEGPPFDLAPDPDEGAPREYPPPAEVLAAVADESAALPFADLPALSAPDDAAVEQVIALWGRIAAGRRRDLLAALERLADDDVTLDFERVQLSALRDPDPAARILAIRGLRESERPALAGLLADMLADDPEASVRAAAAGGLAGFVVGREFGALPSGLGDRVADALRERIEDVTEDDGVRSEALAALGAASEEWVAELIAEHYGGGGVRMRLAAVRAMGRHGSDDWLPVLIRTFGDDDGEVRAAAAASAGALLLEEAVEPLTLLLEDEDEEVQTAAIRAIGEIAGERAEQVLHSLLRSAAPHLADAAGLAMEEARMMSADFASGRP